MVDIIICTEGKIELACLVSQVVYDLDDIRSISFRHPVLIAKAHPGGYTAAVGELGSDVDKTFRHVVVHEVQEFTIGAEIELQFVDHSLREFRAQAQHDGIVYFHACVLGSEQTTIAIAVLDLVGVHEMQIIVFQGQQVPFIDDPVKFGKSVPCLLFDIDGAILFAGGEPELVLYDIDDGVQVGLTDLQGFFRVQLRGAAVIEVKGTERNGIGILVVGNEKMYLILDDGPLSKAPNCPTSYLLVKCLPLTSFV